MNHDLKNIYSTKKYLYYIILPVLLAIAAFVAAFVTPGLTMGLDIVGGTMIIVQADKALDSDSLETALQENFSLEELKVTATGNGVRIQFREDPVFASTRKQIAEASQLLENNPDAAKQKAIDALETLSPRLTEKPNLSGATPREAVETAAQTIQEAQNAFDAQLQKAIFSSLNLSENEARFQKREVGSALGQAFWQNAVFVVSIGLVLIAIVIFVFFREFFPTLSIILAAIIDILTALAGMAIFGIPLSLVTLPALLMLIGYAVDTEILMSTRLFKKREGSDADRAWESFQTGMTMTGTAIGTLIVMVIFSNFSQMMVIFEIAAVLLFGLVGDIITSWFLNAPMLLWHAEKKHGVVH